MSYPDSAFRAAVSCAADAMIALRPDLTVQVWNPAAERLFGWRCDEVMGEPVPIVPVEYMAEHRAVLERVREGGQVSFATRRLNRDDRLIDVRCSLSAMRAADGELLGWVAIHRPIEEDETVQHHLAERIRLVRRLNGVLADLNADLELPAVLDRITASLIELTGADAAGFVRIDEPGNLLRLVTMRGLPDKLRGATAELSSSLVGELLRSDRTVMLATADTRSLGDLIWSELTGLHTIALGVSNVQGRPYGALYALFSGRRVGHIELELLELLAGHAGVAVGNAETYAEVVRQRAHERAIIDASADGIAVLDSRGMVRQWNPAAHQITGIATEEITGCELPFDPPRSGEKRTFQLRDGVWLDVMCADIEETGERVIDFRDVTEAKSLEEAKDLFLATTSHELRTPITVVQGFASTLDSRWDALGEDERRSAVAMVADRARSLKHLVDHLLLGSRAGADELPVNIERFDLSALLHGEVTAFRSLSDKHELELDVPGDLPPVLGDPMANDIVIGQLLENAVKYSPDGGTVTVRARPAGAEIVVTVDDEGVGIPQGDQERVFERFVQSDTGDRRRFGGVGLGLYIVQRLVRAQHGTISAHSRDCGGTRMRLTLPRSP